MAHRIAHAPTLVGEEGELLCGDIYDRLGLPASTGSYHTKLLREAGITRARAAGTQRLITLRRDDLESRFPGLEHVNVSTSMGTPGAVMREQLAWFAREVMPKFGR